MSADATAYVKKLEAGLVESAKDQLRCNLEKQNTTKEHPTEKTQ